MAEDTRESLAKKLTQLYDDTLAIVRNEDTPVSDRLAAVDRCLTILEERARMVGLR